MTKEELNIKELKNLIELCIIQLIDDGIKVSISKTKYSNYVIEIIGRKLDWNNISDDIITVIKYIDTKYKIDYIIRNNEPKHINIRLYKNYIKFIHKNEIEFFSTSSPIYSISFSILTIGDNLNKV